MIKAAVFDLDGTLANTMPDLVITLNIMRAHFGYAPITEKEVLRAVNNATPRYVRLCLPDDFDESRIEEALTVYFAAYEEHYLDKTKPYDGISSMLTRLRDDGVRLSVMSNKDDGHVKKMAATLFPGLFDSAWGTVAGVPVKPDPARAFLIAEEFGFAPSEIAFIGDSDVDMITATHAGMIPVGVSWGYRDCETLRNNGALHLASNADDLYQILKSL